MSCQVQSYTKPRFDGSFTTWFHTLLADLDCLGGEWLIRHGKVEQSDRVFRVSCTATGSALYCRLDGFYHFCKHYYWHEWIPVYFAQGYRVMVCYQFGKLWLSQLIKIVLLMPVKSLSCILCYPLQLPYALPSQYPPSVISGSLFIKSVYVFPNKQKFIYCYLFILADTF